MIQSEAFEGVDVVSWILSGVLVLVFLFVIW